MHDVSVRRMTESDLPAADRLRAFAGWNQTPADWRLLLALEPGGCFVALRAGEMIGTVTTMTYGRALAWIGMMLVHPDHRRRGIGSSLMRQALEYLYALGVPCVRLDATPAGRPVYERIGFVGEWSLTRHERPATRSSEEQESPVVAVRDLMEEDWMQVGEIDTRHFGAPRESLLRGLARSSRRALVCETNGRVVGWGLLRPGVKADYLGPLGCANADFLLPLVTALLRSAERRAVCWDVPDDNEPAVAAAQRFGFRPVRPFTRMRLGADSIPGDPRSMFGIADPALG